MVTALQDFFESYSAKPVTGDCHKKLGALLRRCPPSETEQFLSNYRPTQLHLQLLRALAARTLGACSLLLEGIASESKEVSRFCVSSASLYWSRGSEVYDPNVLLPLLQTVSFTIRNKLLFNLAKYMTDDDEKADVLYKAVVEVWGPAAARPLLCRASRAEIEERLQEGLSLSSFQMLTISRRFPELALTLLEKVPLGPASLKAAQVLVRDNFPESLGYCVSNKYLKLLSKTSMRTVLKNHLDLVMAAPSEWASILDIECVRKVLRPETFELFVLKQVESELKVSSYVLCFPSSYIQHLSPQAVSFLVDEIDCTAIESFWEINGSLLKLVETADRNRIASELFAKTKSLDWVVYMSCEKSIPLLKENLSSEGNAFSRARLVEHLLATVELNKDEKALEQVCDFVAFRYRNDKDVLRSFFQHLPDMSLVDEKTWTIVYSLGMKFLDPSGSSYVYGMDKLFSAALKRNGRSGLKIYVDRFLSRQTQTNHAQDLTDLAPELREECVSLIFTDENVDSDDSDTVSRLGDLLAIVSRWNSASANRIQSENINKFVVKNAATRCAVDFVLNKRNGFPTDLMEECFETSGSPELLARLVLRNPGKMDVSNEALDKMASDLMKDGCWKHVRLLKTLKKKGHVDILRRLSEKSLAAIKDVDQRALRHSIILLALTSEDSEFLEEARKLLSEMRVGQELSAPFLARPEPSDCQEQENVLKLSQQKESVLKGIGNSFSFVDTPSLAVDLLLQFCINGDLMLFVRDSVYSVSFSLPGPAAKDLLCQLVQKPVSVMKHALRIHRLISDVQTCKEFLTGQIPKTHLTVRTCLFEYAFSCLQNTKSADIWQALEAMLLSLTPKDKALLTLLRAKKVPVQFWERYVQLLLDKCNALEDATTEFVSSVLNKISDSISTMPISKQFHEDLIRDYFLSDRFYPQSHLHQSACRLVFAYLMQKDLESDVEHKKLFLAERLSCSAPKEAVVVFDAQLGSHPLKTLLDQFVRSFSSMCRHQEEDGVQENMNNLSVFTPTLLAFLARLDENLMFGSFVCLSLTDISCRRGKQVSESTGRLVARFVHNVLKEDAGLARFALPVLVQNFFAGRKLDSGFLQDILLPLEPHSEESLMIRQMIVAKLLPSNWLKDKSLESFRKQFMSQVRNTPCEVLLFAD